MRTWFKPLLILTILISTSVLSGCASTPHANQVGNWDRLGTREVNWRVDHDVIRVTAREGLFSKLQFRVTRAPIEIYDCTVHFADGSKHEVALRDVFAAGSASRVVDLPGKRRVITRVEFTYRKVRRGKATPKVVLYGRH